MCCYYQLRQGSWLLSFLRVSLIFAAKFFFHIAGLGNLNGFTLLQLLNSTSEWEITVLCLLTSYKQNACLKLTFFHLFCQHMQPLKPKMEIFLYSLSLRVALYANEPLLGLCVNLIDEICKLGPTNCIDQNKIKRAHQMLGI